MAPWMKVVLRCDDLKAERTMPLRSFAARVEREFRVRVRVEKVGPRAARVEVEGKPFAVIFASGRLMEYARRELGACVDVVEEHLAL